MKFLDRIVEKVIAKQIENYKTKLLENKDEILEKVKEAVVSFLEEKKEEIFAIIKEKATDIINDIFKKEDK